jgi:hypothetical protein
MIRKYPVNTNCSQAAMKSNFPIHDLFIRKLSAIEQHGEIHIPILAFDDHLLRRFGFAESVRLEPEHQSDMKVREVADEIWASLGGEALFRWRDLREESPSYEQCYERMIQEPTLALIPFGVAFGVQTFNKPVHIIRFSTHLEGLHDGDRNLPWEAGTCP